MDYEKLAKDFCKDYEVDSSNFHDAFFEYIDGLVPLDCSTLQEEYDKLDEPNIIRIRTKQILELGLSSVEQYVNYKVFEAYYGELYPLVESILEEREEE